ncbi:hypothetical protein WAF17_00900 [Bernardetia sp. ABR2-2B]|uniref:hypothetical protein n=1 Tax=Bernardetia sp. ABR2-2B TaxID=3127472 RepID=UPI0030D27336
MIGNNFTKVVSGDTNNSKDSLECDSSFVTFCNYNFQKYNVFLAASQRNIVVVIYNYKVLGGIIKSM